MKKSWIEIKATGYSLRVDRAFIASVNRKRTLLLCVLARYQIIQQMEQQAREFIGRCPFKVSWSPSHGPFMVSKANGRWRCQGCKKEGGVVEFVSRMERIEPELAAVLISAWFPRRWVYQVVRG